MRSQGFFTLVVCLSFSSSPLCARIIQVPGDQETIQAAIHEAIDGDTVMIAKGVYHESEIDFGGKSITVTGTNPTDPNVVYATIVDASSSGRVFTFHSGEEQSSILSGLTITGGHTQDWGGGIACRNASPTIRSCIVRNNVSDHGGGGIFCEESSPVIEDNIIEDNFADWGGGGIRCSTASPTIRDNIIRSNEAEYGGGIDMHYNASPLIIGNRIEGNSAVNGGGLYCYRGSSPWVIKNIITRNVGTFGGGIHCRYESAPVLDGNTIVANSAALQGGGIRLRFSSWMNVVNSVLWDNTAPVGPEVFIGDGLAPAPSALTIQYSNLEGGIFSIYVELDEGLTWGPGMIDSDPLFCLPERWDYRLTWDSPCIDAGHPDDEDPDLTRRDIGASSFDQTLRAVLYLTPDSISVPRGGQLGVTYTVCNRWPEAITFDVETDVRLPDGSLFPIFRGGPYDVDPERTVRARIEHVVPPSAPTGVYEYRSKTIFPHDAIAGEDMFRFVVSDSAR
jgi:hypothetical protein